MVKYAALILLIVIMVSVGLYYDLSNVIERVRSSAVSIHAQSKHGKSIHGSGMVVGDGLILTARHVIDDVNNVCVEFDDGTKVKSSVFFRAKPIDAGLIIIDTGDRSVLSFGSDANIGDTIFVIGSPFKYKNSVSTGVLSAYDRDIEDERLHQLDLSVNRGMSGGLVFNRYGSVIGMVTRGRYGLGFMLPGEVCQFVVDVYANVQKAKIK